MEFEDLSAEVEWEARRVAAAFGINNFEREHQGQNESDFSGSLAKGVKLEWGVKHPNSHWTEIRIWLDGEFSEVSPIIGGWMYLTDLAPSFDEVMARGLHRLDFEDEDVWRGLSIILTAHEKLELRLSMPREFWPKTWIDE